ncbi:siderophore-interacting protein [Nocardioides sp. AE5]|uniref:siderophore-interacting protein n=1 Tax=Nocardioides sp. AE5 TaxID=2962573 RepID=UPI002881D8C5|nr:siderophore-interacting protein [Nocardioides sp. AE5]MDT0200886.1 siderophore-interacting protein [Nocardioides sp. AE5]
MTEARGNDVRRDPEPAVRAHQDRGRGTVRVPYPVGIRTTTVLARTEVTPHMLRLTLAGPEIARLHSHACDDHVGVVFPLEDGTRNDPTYDPDRLMLDWSAPAPPMRKYTIRRHDPAAGELDLDIVLHPGGLASDWAVGAQPGDEVVLAGPPGSLAFAHTYSCYVFAIDTTALPALARWLEEGDWIEERGVAVHVLVDHDHPGEVDYPLPSRPGLTVAWLPRAGGSQLATAVAELDLAGADPGDTFLFAAGEAGDIKPLRRWSKEQGIDSLVTGYWKRGAVELDHDDEGLADGEEAHDHDHQHEHGHDHAEQHGA